MKLNTHVFGYFRLMKQTNAEYRAEYRKKRYLEKREYYKQYYFKNKEQLLKKDKEYKDKNKSKIKDKRNKEKEKQYYISNKDKIKNYQLNNKNKIKERRKNRYKTDLKYKLICYIRSYIYGTLKNKRSRRTLEVLGCSPEQLIQHLESQFQPWMTWENMGGRSISTPNTTWDVDHIIPLSSAQTEEDVYRLSHYTNLQPLCSYYNRFVKRDNL